MTWNNKQTNELFGAILQLKTTDEARRFFRDLLTEDELKEFGNLARRPSAFERRFLYQNRRPYPFEFYHHRPRLRG